MTDTHRQLVLTQDKLNFLETDSKSGAPRQRKPHDATIPLDQLKSKITAIDNVQFEALLNSKVSAQLKEISEFMWEYKD